MAPRERTQRRPSRKLNAQILFSGTKREVVSLIDDLFKTISGRQGFLDFLIFPPPFLVFNNLARVLL